MTATLLELVRSSIRTEHSLLVLRPSLILSFLSTTIMSDYEDDSVMQPGSDDQPAKARDPLDDEEGEEDDQPPRRSRYEDDEEEEEEEEEGVTGDSRTKKKAKARAFFCCFRTSGFTFIMV